MGKVLLLEDDTVLARQITYDLAGEGHTVTTFAAATDALKHLEKNDVDIVIADIFIQQDGEYVPDGGIRLISTIRQLQARDTPVIAISGSFEALHGDHIAETAKTVGATATLAKPFHPDELLKLVHEQVKRAAA